MSLSTRNAHHILFALLFVTLFITFVTSSLNCRRSKQCHCMVNNYQRTDVEFMCNSADDDTATNIRIAGNERVLIQCDYHQSVIFPPDVYIGSVSNVEVSYCQIQDNVTQVRYLFISLWILSKKNLHLKENNYSLSQQYANLTYSISIC